MIWKRAIFGVVACFATTAVCWYFVFDTAQSRRMTSRQISGLVDQARSNPNEPRYALQLLAMTKSSSSFKACFATAGLGRIGDAAIPVIEEIGALMDSPIPCVSQEAARSLGRLGKRSAPALQALEKHVRKRPTDSTTWLSVKAMGAIGEPAVIYLPTLREMLGTEPEMFEGEVENAIKKISNSVKQVEPGA